jgi:hypothetical protein
MNSLTPINILSPKKKLFLVDLIHIKQQVHILEHSKLYFISFAWHTMLNAKLQIPSKLVILINDKFPIQNLFSKP